MLPKKIVICEDHALVADGIRVLLSFQGRFQLAGQAANETELLPILQSTRPDILILDLNLGARDGFSVLTSVRQIYPELKILILTMYSEDFLVDKARKLGANGYLLKNTGNDELIEALDGLYSTDFYLPQALLKQKQANGFHRDEFIEKMKLTRREIEIIRLISAGRSSEQLSDELFLSVHTVRTHKKNIMKKLGLTQTSELVRFAYENHLV